MLNTSLNTGNGKYAYSDGVKYIDYAVNSFNIIIEKIFVPLGNDENNDGRYNCKDGIYLIGEHNRRENA